MNKILLTLAALAAIPAPAAAAHEPAGVHEEEVRIPFLHLRSMRTFRVVDDETIYVQASGRRWYRVRTIGPCRNLRFARRIGVDTGGSPTFDRFSVLVVDDDRCQVSSVVRADGPPPRRKRSRA